MRKEGRVEAHPIFVAVILAVAVIFVISVVSFQGIMTGKDIWEPDVPEPLSTISPNEEEGLMTGKDIWEPDVPEPDSATLPEEEGLMTGKDIWEPDVPEPDSATLPEEEAEEMPEESGEAEEPEEEQPMKIDFSRWWRYLIAKITGRDTWDPDPEVERATLPEEVGQQLEQMNQEMRESTGLIIKVISKAEISPEELMGSEVNVIPGEVTVNNVVVPTSVANLIVDVGEEHVRVKTTGTKVVIEDSGAEAIANEISIKNNALSIGGATIKVPPSEALSDITAKVVAVELKEEGGKAVYMVRTEKMGKIFGLFAVKAHKEFKVSAESGRIMEESGGSFWWRFI